MGARHVKTPGLVVAFFALLFVVYVGVFPYIGVINNPNENVRTYMTMALVEEGTFKIDAMVERHGWTNDMARAPDKKTGVFHLYSVKAPAVSYAGVPVYWAFTKVMPRLGRPVPTLRSPPEERARWLADATWALRLFSVQLPCFAFLVWLERYLRGTTQDPVLRLAAVAALGLGTNYLAYALMFASHALFAVAAFVSFAVTARARATRARERTARDALVAGFCAGWVTLLEYHALPVSVVLALYAAVTFYRPTRLAALAVGGLSHVALMAFFQWRAFGSPLTPGHRMSENGEFARLLNQGYFGIQTPNVNHAGNLLFNPGYGLFGTSPYLWLGLLAVPFVVFSGFGGPRARGRRRSETLVWLAACGVLLLTVSAAINWRGGWTVGPRYLGACPAFLVFGAVTAQERLARGGQSRARRSRRTWVRAIAAGAALASAAQTGLVSVLTNSLPESVGRPLPEVAIPLLRAGFVPRHLLDLAGYSSPAFGYFVVLAGALACGLLLLGAPPAREAWTRRLGRAGLGLAVASLALVPAFTTPLPEEGTDGGVAARRYFAEVWEPAGRDRIAKLREHIAKTHAPCGYLRLAALEKTMALDAEAAQHAALAGDVAPETCK